MEKYNDCAGCYGWFDQGVCVYIGQSVNLGKRIRQHIASRRFNQCDLRVWDLSHIEWSGLEEKLAGLRHYERQLIRHFDPIENKKSTIERHFSEGLIPGRYAQWFTNSVPRLMVAEASL